MLFQKNTENQGVSAAVVMKMPLIRNILGFVHICVSIFWLCDGFGAYVRV